MRAIREHVASLVEHTSTVATRLFLGVVPFVAPNFAKLARALFSIRCNERFAVPATLGLRRLSYYPVSTKSLAVNFSMPAKVRLSLNDYTQASSYFSGLPPLCVTLMEHATNKSLFFDIGANIGLVSLALSKVLPPASIHAFEANPEVCRVLENNFRNNCPGARVHNIALSDRTGVLELNTIHNDSGSSSLDPERFATRTEWHGQPVTSTRMTVGSRTLSDLVMRQLRESWDAADKVLCKIDVEGHELQVLRGMQDLFRETEKSALCVVETCNEHAGQVNEIFAAWGFTAHRPCWNTALAMHPHHTDLVFKR